jgi:hypothetical protein
MSSKYPLVWFLKPFFIDAPSVNVPFECVDANYPRKASYIRNIQALCDILTTIDVGYGKPLSITLGFIATSMILVFRKYGVSIAHRSPHCLGAAVDVRLADPSEHPMLLDWIKINCTTVIAREGVRDLPYMHIQLIDYER